MHHSVISRIPFFESAGESFIAEVVMRMRPLQASSGDVIIRAGEVGSEMYAAWS